MPFTAVEEEVVFLKAIVELIDSMVNREVFDLLGEDPNCEIRFHSATYMKYFNIILLDFLSQSDNKVLGKQLSYLGAIETICKSPSFDISASINNLRISTQEFTNWLEQEPSVEIWLPSLDKQTTLSIKRIEFTRMCGNISKHNFSRLSDVVKKLIAIFDRNGITIGFEDALLILSQFYDRFHSDILVYHGATISEFLNNIRWGIHEYLEPEFQQSIVYEEAKPPRMYHYTYPQKIKSDFARNCYWDLMNCVRAKPYVRKFQVTRYLKMKY
jgi:hypothetical protein